MTLCGQRLQAHRFCPLVALIMLMANHGMAEERRSLLPHHHRHLEWLKNHDSTLVSSYISSEFSYERHASDADFYKIKNTLRWCYPIAHKLDLGLQMMIPIKWHETTTSNDFGLGDIELRPALIGRISHTVRYALELNTVIGSATKSTLGDNALILRPTAALRWDMNTHTNIGLNVEYNFTPMDEGINDVRALELKFPLVCKLGNGWSTALTYKPKWNFLTEDDRHRLKWDITRVWGKGHAYALSLGSEVPLQQESFDFKVYLSARCFF